MDGGAYDHLLNDAFKGLFAIALALAAVFILFGVFIGWMIWG